jgi:hypothetical protein
MFGLLTTRPNADGRPAAEAGGTAGLGADGAIYS